MFGLNPKNGFMKSDEGDVGPYYSNNNKMSSSAYEVFQKIQEMFIPGHRIHWLLIRNGYPVGMFKDVSDAVVHQMEYNNEGFTKILAITHGAGYSAPHYPDWPARFQEFSATMNYLLENAKDQRIPKEARIGWMDVLFVYVMMHDYILIFKPALYYAVRDKIAELIEDIRTKNIKYSSGIITVSMPAFLKKLELMNPELRPKHRYNLRPRK